MLKYEEAQPFNFKIENKKCLLTNKCMEQWLLKIQLCITEINYILKYIQIENGYFKL